MIPFLLASVGGYLIGNSIKESQTFAKGGKTKKFTTKQIVEHFQRWVDEDSNRMYSVREDYVRFKDLSKPDFIMDVYTDGSIKEDRFGSAWSYIKDFN